MSFADDFNVANDVCKGHQKFDVSIKPTLTSAQSTAIKADMPSDLA